MLLEILYEKKTFSNKQYKNVWLLASGALNMLNMDHNRDYYFTLRDQIEEYPNLCFG